jgi:hypothetical protein
MIGPYILCLQEALYIYSIEDSHDMPLYTLSIGGLLYIHMYSVYSGQYKGLS